MEFVVRQNWLISRGAARLRKTQCSPKYKTRQSALGDKRLRFAGRKRSIGEIYHFVAALVERPVTRLLCVCRIKREKEHASLGAVFLLVSRRMPTRPKALGRENDKLSTGFGNRVTDLLFERAHESRYARSARANARSFGENRFGFARVERSSTMAFESVKNGKIKNLKIPVPEPTMSKKLDFTNRLEESAVYAAQMGASGIFFNIIAKRRELAAFFDDPIVPIGGENRAFGPEVVVTATTRRTLRGGGVLRRRAATLRNRPILFREFSRKLPDKSWERFLLLGTLKLNHQMKMVRHNNEGRNLFDTGPFCGKARNDRSKLSCQLVFDEFAIRADVGKVSETITPFKRYHIIKWRCIIESKEPSHEDVIIELGINPVVRGRRSSSCRFRNREWRQECARNSQADSAARSSLAFDYCSYNGHIISSLRHYGQGLIERNVK